MYVLQYACMCVIFHRISSLDLVLEFDAQPVCLVRGRLPLRFSQALGDSLDAISDIFSGALGLDKAWDAKPLLNGKEIMNVLQLKSGGPLVREWVSYKF